MVGGVDGSRFDVAVGNLPKGYSADCGSDCVNFFRFSSGGRPLTLSEGYKLRLVVLEDVGGERILVGSAGPTSEFDEHAPEAQKVIESVDWAGR